MSPHRLALSRQFEMTLERPTNSSRKQTSEGGCNESRLQRFTANKSIVFAPIIAETDRVRLGSADVTDSCQNTMPREHTKMLSRRGSGRREWSSRRSAVLVFAGCRSWKLVRARSAQLVGAPGH